MTMHLSPQEFVSAVEGDLSVTRQAHVESCAACQAQVEDLRTVLQDAEQDAVVPEPSPLFWDHFPARVLNAVEHESTDAQPAWWANLIPSRPFLALGAASLMIVASAAVYLSRPVAPTVSPLTEAGVPAETTLMADTAENDEWDFVSGVMGTLEADDMHEVLIPSRHAVDAAMETLSNAEREALMKLLKAEIGADIAQGTE